MANAGLILVATFAEKLGLARIISEKVNLAGRVGGANPSNKSLTLIHAIVAGASYIDHVDILRAGASSKVLPFGVVAPSTLGTYLRSFSFGHVRQLDAVIESELKEAWAFGMTPLSLRIGSSPSWSTLDQRVEVLDRVYGSSSSWQRTSL